VSSTIRPAEWSAEATAGATSNCPTEPDVRTRTPGSPLLTDYVGEWVCAISQPGPRSVAPPAGGAERLRIEAATSRVNPVYLRGHAGVGVVGVTLNS
jgi:hypothetical protein